MTPVTCTGPNRGRCLHHVEQGFCRYRGSDGKLTELPLPEFASLQDLGRERSPGSGRLDDAGATDDAAHERDLPGVIRLVEMEKAEHFGERAAVVRPLRERL